MPLENLEVKVRNLQLRIQSMKFRDVALPLAFTNSYAALLQTEAPSGYQKVDWAQHTFCISTKTDKAIYGSNYWFYLAFELASLISELKKHRDIFLGIFGANANNDEISTVAKALKNNEEISEVQKSLIDDYFLKNHLSYEEKTNFQEFICQYQKWGGGKTIDRGDYYASSVLKAGNLLAETQNAIAELANQLYQNPELGTLLSHHLISTAQTEVFAKEEAPVLFKSIPKPFVLLAGISGTGKTRFVRAQAACHRADLSNYCLIPVRPDWHEPSDLLGYVSRVGTAQYVVTDLLRFVVAAWKNAYTSATADALAHKDAAQMTPYWLCLDEMNLAPVEQYFADYLAVLETRQWRDGRYSCDALLKAAAFNMLGDADGALGKMRADLNLSDAEFDGLWAYFLKFGIALPPNLMVAGTVNMDETTHGFSRKVIDRAFTVDFGAFYPNDFGEYFVSTIEAKTLGFPCLSAVDLDDLAAVPADSDGQKSVRFLSAVNAVLAQTPFELAFRALNELLMALVCFAPQDDAQLQAVWDDFLMTKVLPRIDGDGHKLVQSNAESLLTRLAQAAQVQCSAIWDDKRLDLLRYHLDGTPCEVACRSKAKLAWMQTRLEANGFTSFWP